MKLAMRTFASAGLFLLMLAPLAAQELPSAPEPRNEAPAAQQRPPVPRPPASDVPVPSITVDVKLVQLFASVADGDGAPYSALGRDDFRIFEDGVEQKLAVFERESDLPLSIAMAVDTSMSTRKDLPFEVASARRFLRTLMRPVDAVAIFQFSTYVSAAQGFTSDVRRADEALGHLRTGSATALYDAIYLASQSLEERRGRKIIVLVTDGGDTSSKTDYQEALRAAQISEAIIYSIIMVPIASDAGRDLGGEHALIQLAQDTGGKSFYAGSTAQLEEAFRQISDQLRTQYRMAYYPSRRVGSEFRRITVALTPEAQQRAGRDLFVRHRAGYYNSKIE